MSKTIVYNNVSEGDWVVCTNCGKKMLLPYGADQCSECTMDGCLQWAYPTDYEEVRTDVLEALGEEMEFVDKKLKPEDYLSPDTLQEEHTDYYHRLLGHTHKCGICGKEMNWDDGIWVNEKHGICEECHSKMNEAVERYDEMITIDYLACIGAIN